MANFKALEKKAIEIRKIVVDMICRASSGHPGGSLSATDILVALYYGGILNVDPENPKSETRDRFVLSKGHAAPALYAVLAEKGFFDKEKLPTLRQYGSPLQGHPDMHKVPGIDASTGSLGQGLSIASGMAISEKIYKSGFNVFTLLGDGELQEGQVWEAAMTAAHYKLDNLVAIVDNNNLQIDGNVDKVMNVDPIDEKFKAFGWEVLHANGHEFESLMENLEKAKKIKGKPTVIIANTVKGKGVSFMENVCGFHGVAPTCDETDQALGELDKCLEKY